MTTAILVLGGWICGSMPWGYWLVRIFRGEDIRKQGSGNIGATNVWRVHGRRLGVPAVLLDTAKGFVPALVATKIAGHDAGVLTGAAAMLGHFRPLFLRFRRGGTGLIRGFTEPGITWAARCAFVTLLGVFPGASERAAATRRAATLRVRMTSTLSPGSVPSMSM